jgi:uncharacterized protein YPO0396
MGKTFKRNKIKCRNTKCRNTKCRNIKRRNTKCRNTKCRNTKCRNIKLFYGGHYPSEKEPLIVTDQTPEQLKILLQQQYKQQTKEQNKHNKQNKTQSVHSLLYGQESDDENNELSKLPENNLITDDFKNAFNL